MKSAVKPIKMTSGRKLLASNKSNATDLTAAGARRKAGTGAISATRRTTQRSGDAQSRLLEQVFDQSPMERIEAIKRGVPAKHFDILAERMAISKQALVAALGLSYATICRKARDNRPLSNHESELIIGIEYLVGQVEHMVRQSGNAVGFDAAKWLATWLQSRLPALGGDTPARFMDTVEGQRLVSNLLAMLQSGAYA